MGMSWSPDEVAVNVACSGVPLVRVLDPAAGISAAEASTSTSGTFGLAADVSDPD